MAAPVWFSQGEVHLPADVDWLSPAERYHHDRMRYTKRRVEFLVARWTSKQALLLAAVPHANVDVGTDRIHRRRADLHRVEIGHAADGAPVPRFDGVDWARRMSSTDRAGWAVTVVSPDHTEVGCDLELVEPRSDAFVADWFTAAEGAYVTAASGDDERFLRANLVWSAKESALKVLRTGLRRDTRSVEVTCPDDGDVDGWSPLRVTAVEGAEFPGWWQRFGDFVLTVASTEPSPPPRALVEPPALASATPVHSWLAEPHR